MLPIQPNTAPSDPTAKTIASLNTPEAGGFGTFLSVFGDGEAQGVVPDNDGSTAAPKKTGKTDKTPDEPEPHSTTHEGYSGDDEIPSEGSSTSVPVAAETDVRAAKTKLDTPGSSAEGTTLPTTFPESGSEPKQLRPDSGSQNGQGPALGVVTDGPKPVSPQIAPDLVLAASAPATQAQSQGRGPAVEPALSTDGITPTQARYDWQNQDLSQPNKANAHSGSAPVEGQNGAMTMAKMALPNHPPLRLIPMMPKTAAPAWTTVPDAAKPKVELGEQVGLKTAQAAMAKPAPNIATPGTASHSVTAPQIMPNPTPARPSTESAALKGLATDPSVPDRPVSRQTAISERVVTQNSMVMPSTGNAPPATPPLSLGAPNPTPIADLAEDHRRAIDPALPDIRFNAEAVPRSGTQPSQVSHAPDLPRHIVQQMAEAVHRNGGDRGVDLLLNPAELGRVRISLSPGEAGMTVQILADRPETLDLIRRHIDLLAQDFQSLGYEATDFAFSQHQDSAQNGTSQSEPSPMEGFDADAPQMPEHPTTSILTDRVDIRL